MQLNLGIKIRELRRRDGRTQDNLAESLGVTAQAVSRWESGGSYPDMEMIPAIANYFHISIDELFGYNDDREKRISEIVEQANKIINRQGQTMYSGGICEGLPECVEMLRDASEEFPNESRILNALGQLLWMWGWFNFGAKGKENESTGIIEEDTEYNSTNIYWQETVQVYEKLLKADAETYVKEWAIRRLVELYRNMGKYDKAKALVNEQSSIIVCREVLMPLATRGEENVKYQGERITNLLAALSFAISDNVSIRPSLWKEKHGKDILLSVINMYETLFVDGNCGFYHHDIGRLYLDLSRYEANGDGDLSKVLEYFDKTFEHSKAYERNVNEGGDYTAPLVSGMGPIEKGDLSPMSEDFWIELPRCLPEKICNELRKNPKYAVCFE